MALHCYRLQYSSSAKTVTIESSSCRFSTLGLLMYGYLSGLQVKVCSTAVLCKCAIFGVVLVIVWTRFEEL